MSVPKYPKYKYSGVEWLGRIPSHWDVIQSRRLFCVRNEKALESDRQVTASQQYGILYQDDFVAREGRKVVETIMGAHTLRRVKPNDFVISLRSFQGGIEWSGIEGAITFHYVVLTPIKYVYEPFFAHLFKSMAFIHALRSTTNLIRDGQDLRFSHFIQVDLPIVSLPEQTAIATFLDAETSKIDALIAEQRRLIELLKEKRQAVISHAVTKGLNPDAPMKASGIEWLGDVPEHWNVKPLKHLSDIKTGFAFKSEEFIDEGVPVIRIGDIGTDGKVDFSNAKCLPPEMLLQHEDSVVQKHDIVMAMTGATIGKAAVFDYNEPALLNQRVCIFRAFNPKSQWYVWYVLQTHYYAEYLAVTAFGGAQPNISDTGLAACRIPIPPIDEQRAIAETLDQTSRRFASLEAEATRAIDLLQERRTALISAAVTGKIDVRDMSRGGAENAEKTK